MLLRQVHARFEPSVQRPDRRLRVSMYFVLLNFAYFTLAGGSRADASCGDYLGHHDMTVAVQSGDPLSPIHRGSIPPQLPCRGPHCRQAPDHPPMPAPNVSFEVQDHWVWTRITQLRPLDATSFLAHLKDPTPLPMIAFRLDRPPRF